MGKLQTLLEENLSDLCKILSESEWSSLTELALNKSYTEGGLAALALDELLKKKAERGLAKEQDSAEMLER